MDAITAKDSQRKKPDMDLRSIRGYMSPTTSTYQFGILEKNQWAGEERLIKKSKGPFDYSITARTNVTAFVISKEEAIKKFPKEFMQFIEEQVVQRYKWIEERAKRLAITSTHVADMDPFNKRELQHNCQEISNRIQDRAEQHTETRVFEQDQYS